MDPLYYEKRLLHDVAREQASVTNNDELSDDELSALVSGSIIKLHEELLDLFEDDMENHTAEHTLEEFAKQSVHQAKSSTRTCCEKLQQLSGVTDELRFRSVEVKTMVESISKQKLAETVSGRIKYDGLQQTAIKENLILHTLQLMKETYTEDPRIFPALSKIKENLLAGETRLQ